MRQGWSLAGVECPSGFDYGALSASQLFELFPYSVVSALYGSSALAGSPLSRLPDYAVAWSVSADGQCGDEACTEARLFGEWIERRFEGMSMSFNGHFPTSGSSHLVVWAKRPGRN